MAQAPTINTLFFNGPPYRYPEPLILRHIAARASRNRPRGRVRSARAIRLPIRRCRSTRDSEAGESPSALGAAQQQGRVESRLIRGPHTLNGSSGFMEARAAT